MIAKALRDKLDHCGDSPFLISPAGQWSYAQTHYRVLQLANALQQHDAKRLACYLTDSPELIAIVLAAAQLGIPMLLLNRDFNEQQVTQQLARLDIELLIREQPVPGSGDCRQLSLTELLQQAQQTSADVSTPPASDSELQLLTSGTTDLPKCVSYRWSDLLAQVGKHDPVADERWLLAYKLNHFAGIQMLAHILVNGSTLVLAGTSKVADAVAAMSKFTITHVSSTPTFWRFAQALLAGTGTLPRLQQITLGSEPIPGMLLEQLAALFPAARIVHIYALTEAGSCVAVSDGKPGLPLSVLERPANAAVRIRIVEEELQVMTRHGMSGYLLEGDRHPSTADGWFATGDLVNIKDQRIVFMGRQSDTINVGGVKVHPLEVENVIAALPGIKVARVYGQDNPVVGQIVAVDLLLEDQSNPQEIEDAVREACTALPRHSRPRNITIVEEMDTNNFKLTRRRNASP